VEGFKAAPLGTIYFDPAVSFRLHKRRNSESAFGSSAGAGRQTWIKYSLPRETVASSGTGHQEVDKFSARRRTPEDFSAERRQQRSA